MLGTQEHHSEWYITTTHNIITTTTQCNDIFTGFTADNRARLKGLNAVDTIKAVQGKHPNLSGKVKVILGRISN